MTRRRKQPQRHKRANSYGRDRYPDQASTWEQMLLASGINKKSQHDTALLRRGRPAFVPDPRIARFGDC
jgi:hypothetical protein